METIARPYARAAFGLAEEEGKVRSWVDFFLPLSEGLKNHQLARHLANPTVDRKSKMALLLGLLDESVSVQQRNFLQLLLMNGRIGFLPMIANLFEEMRLKKENQAVARVQTAFSLEETEKQKIIAYLSRLSGKKVLLKEQVVADLKGGFVIDLEEESLDYSIKEKLNKLRNIF